MSHFNIAKHHESYDIKEFISTLDQEGLVDFLLDTITDGLIDSWDLPQGDELRKLISEDKDLVYDLVDVYKKEFLDYYYDELQDYCKDDLESPKHVDTYSYLGVSRKDFH